MKTCVAFHRMTTSGTVQNAGEVPEGWRLRRKVVEQKREAQFGEASQSKDLRGNGSPRWKQRAFYDFVKDLSPLLIHVPVVRVAVWDTVEDGGRSRTVEEVLVAPFGCANGAALAALIKERAAD
jgi:hypothetical protein